MKNISRLLLVLLVCLVAFQGVGLINFDKAYADSNANYYTIYADESKSKVLFLKGDDISIGDNYLSTDNKLYEIIEVDDKNKTAIAKFLKEEEMPKYNIKKKTKEKIASAATIKKVGVYHTHNDECYFTPDGVDSIYGKGGIHDVGKEFVSNLNKLGIQTVYREDLHLPHNSGAYTRSQVTASAILNEGVDGIFDLHRDSTKRSEYLTTVDGMKMSSVRMVVGSSSANFEENKKFAYSIKSYADEIYPGLIKDIYIGKGNYNQQLSTRAMLFEMGCENIEKALVLKTTPYLAKVIDVVLFGSDAASEESLTDVSMDGENSSVLGLVNSTSDLGVNSNETLFVLLGLLSVAVAILILVLIFSKKARYKIGRFFSEMFAGLFGKKKAR